MIYPGVRSCVCPGGHGVSVLYFSTHIQRKRIATQHFQFQWQTVQPTFQPISSESGLRHISTSMWFIIWCFLFNPYPAKADCDGLLCCLFELFSRCLFNPYPAKADCDGLPMSFFFYVFCLFNPYPAKADCDTINTSWSDKMGGFSTHIQRKRIATVLKATKLSFVWVFSTHIQRKRIATFICKHHALFTTPAFQPISSESGLRRVSSVT